MAIVTTAEADTYFATRLGASTYWISSTEKTAALETAQNDLESVYGDLTDGNADHERAVFEQALFRLMDSIGVDRRASLQAQGVVRSDVVKETFSGKGQSVAICPYAMELMNASKCDLLESDVDLSSDQP